MGNPADSVEPSVATGLPCGRTVLIGCSGGADSVALLAAAVRTGIRCAAGHVDHGLRPESTSEAEHVRELARTLGVGFHLERIEGLKVRGPGLEAAARDARYTDYFFPLLAAASRSSKRWPRSMSGIASLPSWQAYS